VERSLSTRSELGADDVARTGDGRAHTWRATDLKIHGGRRSDKGVRGYVYVW
jgi:hypothetical protein